MKEIIIWLPESDRRSRTNCATCLSKYAAPRVVSWIHVRSTMYVATPLARKETDQNRLISIG